MTEEAIMLMEPGAMVNRGQIDCLAHEPDLRETCEDIFLAQLVLAQKQEQVPNVEAKLTEFHDRVDKHRRMRPIVWTAIAMAAATLAAVFFLRPKEQPAEAQPTAVVFAADNSQQQVTVETVSGTPVPVKVVRKQDKADATVVIGQTELQIEEQLALSVPQGESLQLLLPDGTHVYLHPGSRIVYPNVFTGSSRQVKLTGEAYFCVAHDPQHPFLVSTPQGTICDYGTEFNVSARTDGLTEVVLVEGSVGVTPTDGKEQMLVPGQKCYMEESQCTVEEANTDPYISWRDGYFHFEETTLREILEELGRYYNYNVECPNSYLLNYRMRFIIPRNQDVAYAVMMLNRMGKVKVSLRGNTITVE